MSQPETLALIQRYYEAFNRGDAEGMLACLAAEVAHDVNQGRLIDRATSGEMTQSSRNGAATGKTIGRSHPIAPAAATARATPPPIRG